MVPPAGATAALNAMVFSITNTLSRAVDGNAEDPTVRLVSAALAMSADKNRNENKTVRVFMFNSF
jgi:hypothetical protein